MVLLLLLNKLINFIKNIIFNKKIVGLLVLLSLIFSFIVYLSTFPKKVEAVSKHEPRGGELIVGTELAKSYSNAGSWKGTYAYDQVWWYIRYNTGINAQVYFSNIELNNANKMIVQFTDKMSSSYYVFHQICDWSSSTGVDNAADSQCTGGGWRTLHPQDSIFNSTTFTNNRYEIYNGYFWDRTTSPGTVISTPMTNFISSSGEVRVRSYYATGTTSGYYFLDYVNLELAIDPVYEPANFERIDGGTTTNYVSDIIGARAGIVTASDNTRQGFQNLANTSIDINYTFNGVRKYTGMNTLLINLEGYVSNAALTIGVYLWNYTTSQWTQIDSNKTLSIGEYVYGFSFNNTTVSGFSVDDYINSSGNVKLRFLSNASASQYYFYIDALNMMVGSVNNDTSKCEISLGSGTSTDCSNTRDIRDLATGLVTPTNRWSLASTNGFPSGRWQKDDDGDSSSDYNVAGNISFPVTLNENMSVTGIHYVAQYNANSSYGTIDVQTKDYSGIADPSTWVNNVTATTTVGTIYVYNNSWEDGVNVSHAASAVDTENGLMNMRLHTTVGSSSTFTSTWSFAMMSIRWIEESSRQTLKSWYTPSGNTLVQGSEKTATFNNFGNYKALTGYDANHYWSVDSNSNGTNAQVYFDDVELYNANKIIINISDYISALSYKHQICDWVSSTGVDNAADSQCTTGGWRDLNPREEVYTNTTVAHRFYEIYDGYFWDRTTSPGTVISTPLANFVDSSNNRVLIRVYETASTSKILYINTVQLEVGVDPIYEPGNIEVVSSSNTSGFVSDLIGTNTTDVTPNDSNSLELTTTSDNQNIEFILTFKNFKSLNVSDIMLTNKICASNSATTFKYSIYEVSSDTWADIADYNNANYSLASYTCSSFATHYREVNFDSSLVDSSGNIKIKITTNNLSSGSTLKIDYFHIMGFKVLGNRTENFATENANCGIYGLLGVDTLYSGSISPCSLLSQSGVPNSFFALDDNNNTSNTDHIIDLHLSSYITVPSGASINAIHYGFKLANNNSTITLSPQLRQYGSYLAGGWYNTPASDDINNTSVYYDSWIHTPQRAFAYGFVGTDIAEISGQTQGELGMRIRTSSSTASSQVSAQIDYFGMSIRYVQINDAPVVTNVLFNNQNNITVSGFGTSPDNIVYVTADVSDAQGCNTITTPTACAYRSGASDPLACSGSTNEMENLTCTVSDCSGSGDTTATVSCEFHANYQKDPTDADTPWASEYWRAWVNVSDTGGENVISYTPANAPDINSLLSIGYLPLVGYSIDYESMAMNSSNINPVITETTSQQSVENIQVYNHGNTYTDIYISGDDWEKVGDTNTTIPASSQYFSIAPVMSIDDMTSISNSGVNTNVFLNRSTATPSSPFYFGMKTPTSTPSGSYTGTIYFLGAKHALPWSETSTYYDCNESTWQCDINPSGEYEELATCQSACVEPKYSCNESTWQCYLDEAGEYNQAACTAACVEPKYSCNESTWQCYLDEAGEYNQAACTAACVEPKYSCNESTWQCVLTTPVGDPLATCQSTCVEPKYTCDNYTGQCDLTTPTGDPLATCQASCTQYAFECDITVYQCFRTANGQLDLNACQLSCAPTELEDYFCDTLGQACIWDSQRPGGQTWTTCNSSCVYTYSCNPYTLQCYLDPDGEYEDQMSCMGNCP